MITYKYYTDKGERCTIKFTPKEELDICGHIQIIYCSKKDIFVKKIGRELVEKAPMYAIPANTNKEFIQWANYNFKKKYKKYSFLSTSKKILLTGINIRSNGFIEIEYIA